MSTIHVNNISSQTSEQQVRDFFSFCGKINNLTVKPTSNDAGASKSATVTFEKETAAKTALLLDNTQLGPSQVSVTSGQSLGQLAGSGSIGTSSDAASDPDSVDQEDKPRSRIAAEYLAHGYTLSDKALQRALELDQQHGISARFTNALRTYDEKYKVTDQAKAVDNKYGVTSRGYQFFAGLHSYYEKAANTPTGQRLVDFYNQGQKQVVDIHTEARRLADLKGGKDPKTGQGMSTEQATQANKESQKTIPGTNKTVCQCGGNDTTCPCEPGSCACSGCGKSGISTEQAMQANKENQRTIPGTKKTVCQCGGNDTTCPCEPDNCACSGCGKSGISTEQAMQANKKNQKTVPGTKKTVCQCGGNDTTCPCEPDNCACSGCGKSGVAGEYTATGNADIISATSGLQPLPEKVA